MKGHCYLLTSDGPLYTLSPVALECALTHMGGTLVVLIDVTTHFVSA